MSQAENDLEFARLAIREKYYAQACFICQQAAEKAMKALIYRQGERVVLGHSVFELLNRIKSVYPELETYSELAGVADQFYVPTRHPNGLPDGVPFQVFTEKQAASAFQGAESLVRKARELLGT
ncbi:MAG TPA: HEPN domain-containing protein [Acidobacteriota bacterium]